MPDGDEAELVSRPEAEAILTGWQRVPPGALDAAPALPRRVGRYGMGVDNIPVAHATELGILVTNVPDFCLEEVSDHALALLLACARRVVTFARATRGRRVGPRRRPPIAAAARPDARPDRLRRHRPHPRAEGAGVRLAILAYTPRLAPGDARRRRDATNDLEELLDRRRLRLHPRAGDAARRAG